jgi:hypothetical protein
VYLENTVMGDQILLDPINNPIPVPQDNQWFSTPSGGFDVFNTVNTGGPNWYYRSGVNYDPLPISPNAANFILISNPPTSTCPVPPPPCPGNICIQNQLSSITQSIILSPVFTEEIRYKSSAFVFSELLNNPLLTNLGTGNDAVLKRFYDSIEVTSLGKLAHVNKQINNKNFVQASALNSSTAFTNIMEENQKAVNEIFLDAVIMRNGFNNDRINMLRKIADQCAYTGGLGVYGARSLINLALDTIVDFEDNCIEKNSSKNIIDNNKKVAEYLSGYYKLYPNPNNGNMQLEYEIGKEQKGVFIIYDLLGEKVLEYRLNTGNTSLNLTGEMLRDGIYYYQIIINEKIVQQEKVVIIK